MWQGTALATLYIFLIVILLTSIYLILVNPLAKLLLLTHKFDFISCLLIIINFQMYKINAETHIATGCHHIESKL